MSAAETTIRYLMGHAHPPQQSYLRGSVDARIASHVVMVTTRTGAQLLRRVSLTAVQMGQLESQLMIRQHAGDIHGYLISAAEDVSFAGILSWVDSFKGSGEQQELLCVEQDVLFFEQSKP